QRRALNRQQAAQQEQSNAAAADARQAGEENARARRQQTNLGSLLTQAQQDALGGAGATLLNPAGIDSQRLKLGKTSLLGS
ncbi:MAG: hypothetical protein VKL39_14070, partial [Leptolyngbyaceae bacterium]|nr:hypothetical protein [Leptolyngbyaceae bacterium]